MNYSIYLTELSILEAKQFINEEREVNWSNPILMRLSDKLQLLKEELEDINIHTYIQQEYVDIVIDIENLDFWEQVLKANILY